MPSETSSNAMLSANHVVSNASLFTDIVSIYASLFVASNASYIHIIYEMLILHLN